MALSRLRTLRTIPILGKRFCSLSLLKQRNEIFEAHSEEDQKKLLAFSEYSKANNNVVLLHATEIGTFTRCCLSMWASKLSAYFTANNINFELDPSRSVPLLLPMHKTPWITYKDEHIADTDLIINYFNHELGIDNDKNLTNEQRAISTSFKIAVENQIYWIELYRRWYPPHNGQQSMTAIYPDNPEKVDELCHIFGPILQSQLWAVGISRFPTTEIYRKLCTNVESIVDYMGNKSFFHGEDITSIDFSLYGQLGSMYSFDLPFPGDNEGKYPLPFKKEVNDYVDRVIEKLDLKF